MRKALWFSRHEPTEVQREQIAAMGMELVAVEEGKALGAISIETDADLDRVVAGLLALATTHELNVNSGAIFGVPSTPLLGYMQRCYEECLCVDFYAAWNVTRSVEGGKPTFAHKKWVLVGSFTVC